MKIPRVNPVIKKELPNQFCEILNRVIDRTNDLDGLDKTLEEINKTLASLQEQIDALQPTPPTPTGEWTQILQFDIANMGNTPGWCLQNTREGFGIATGTFASARADMESQIANGTLHSGTPPLDVAVPIYYNNAHPDGHVCVWDHGLVYSDKRLCASIDAVDSGYAGWGELCDGTRVVQHV